MPEISVLIPVYNVEKYLEECLESILGQTFRNMEIICVDDGSTDASGEILDRYASLDARIRVIHKKNTGYGNSMNVALGSAQGTYIAIVESDDFAEPDMLQSLYECAVANGAEVVKGTFYNHRYGKDEVSKRLDNYPKNVRINCESCPEILDLADTIWSCLYRRSFLTGHGIRFHETPGASYQDISFALQVWLRAETVIFLDQPVLHYRRDNPESSMNHPGKLFCVFDEYAWVEERCGDVLCKRPETDAYLTAVKYRDCFDHYNRVGVQFQYTLLCRMADLFRRDKEVGRVREDTFRPQVWELLCRMEQDCERFFRETAKPPGYCDINPCWFENQEIYGQAFMDRLTDCKQLIIYGAGQIGKRLASAVMARGGRVSGFAVTSMKGQESFCMEIPVRELESYADLADTCMLVIAVAKRSQHAMYDRAREQGFLHIYRVDEAVRRALDKGQEG